MQLQYTEQNVRGFSHNPDGLALSGAAALNERFYLFADTRFTRGQAQGSTVDTGVFALGLGAHVALDERTDLVAELGWARAEVQTLGARVGEQGLALSVGARLWVAAGIELDAALVHVDLVTPATGAGAARCGTQRPTSRSTRASTAWRSHPGHPTRAAPAPGSPVARPRTWLSSSGWRRHGPLDLDAGP